MRRIVEGCCPKARWGRPVGLLKKFSRLPRQPRRGGVAGARSRNFDAGSWPRASRNNFPGDGRSFRDSHGKPAPSHARAPLFWRWRLPRRASRNNFPGDGQSFCDSLPCACFRRFGAGGWPDGLPETSFRWTPTAMANPRRRTRALRYFGAGGWPVGLPETIFRAKLPRQPWQTRAVARARSAKIRLPETSFRATQGGGNLGGRRGICGPKPMSQHGRPRLSNQASDRNGRFINQKRTSGQIPSFGLRMADFILSRIRSLPVAHLFFLVYEAFPPPPVLGTIARCSLLFLCFLARRASRNNFPGDGRSFRDSHGKPAPSHARAPLFWRWGLARRASRHIFPGDGQSFCDGLPRARFRRFGAGGWPDGLPETSFRAMQSGGILDADSHGKPAPSHARAPLFRRWGLARRASRNNLPGEASAAAMANPRRRARTLRQNKASRNKFPSDARRGDLGSRRGICGPKPMSGGPDYQGRGPGQWPQWPFYQPEADKWPDP